jgi:ubiquinone/menaquinone biosynthesis C-methylase UbiE
VSSPSKQNPQSADGASYALGYSGGEHERLIRQATRFAPYTERLFRDAGIGVGQRVLELGSGVGDVSMLLARLVGPSGEVVGIERDEASIAVATRRVEAAGLHNVRFVRTDVSQVDPDRPYDALAGRFILMFLPDPAAVLRALLPALEPGATVVFQEPSFVQQLAFNQRFPLYSALLQSVRQALMKSGANVEMGPDLYRVYQAAGLQAPSMHMEQALGVDAEFISIVAGLILSMEALARQHAVPLDALGELRTLPERIHAEIEAANAVASLVALVGAWSRVRPIMARAVDRA